MTTEKTPREMLEMLRADVRTLYADLIKASTEVEEKNGETMRLLEERAQKVGAAEAVAELFFAMLANQASASGPTNVELNWQARAGFSPEAKARAKAASRSITKFFNSWDGE